VDLPYQHLLFRTQQRPPICAQQNWLACGDVVGFMSSAHDKLRQNGPDAIPTFLNPELVAQETQ
jgi:hypothetical protein